MEVKLDLAVAASDQRFETVEELGPILLAREKEGVLRWPAVGVSKGGRHARVVVHPLLDARACLFDGGILPERLVVIADREQHMPETVVLGQQRRADPLSEIATEPELEVFASKVVQHGKSGHGKARRPRLYAPEARKRRSSKVRRMPSSVDTVGRQPSAFSF